MWKKLLSLLLTITMVMGMGKTTFASNINNDVNSSEYQKYMELINNDILGRDVSYEYWLEVNEQSAELESYLENSTDFNQVYSSEDELSLRATYIMQQGDVFITNGTSYAGLTGHAGIAMSPYYIIHIMGPGKNPTPASLIFWNSTYSTGDDSWTKIYRHIDSSIATKAGQWASDKYLGSNATYKITMDLTSFDETYCSKIVWQSYYYGPDFPNSNGPTWGLRSPYVLPTAIFDLEHTFTFE